MKKETFKDNLNSAVILLSELTASLCSNSLSRNLRFSIKPNARTLDSHLSQDEINFHNKVLGKSGDYLNEQEVADFLWTNDKVPLWINISISEAHDDWTTVELLTSRRLRTEKDLNHVVDKFPPFHIQVPLPPNHLDGVKFDINWKTQSQKRSLWSLIKRKINV
jgi:hypothetical protein